MKNSNDKRYYYPPLIERFEASVEQGIAESGLQVEQYIILEDEHTW